MIRRAGRIVFIIITVTLLTVVGHAQVGNEIKIFDLLVRGNAAPGYYLLAPTTNTNVSFTDHGGWLVHRRPEPSTINLQRHHDGTYTYFVPRVGHVRLDSTFTTAIDTINVSRGSTDFHELTILRNGNYLVLGVLPRTVDMSALVDGGKTNANVGDALMEEQRPDGTVVWSWNSKDHVNILDATADIELKGATVDYIHVNSVEEDTDGHLIVSARHFDEVLKIDRSTGALLWRLGGKASKHNQFRWLNDTVGGFWGFSHQHTVSRTQAGRLLMFDNGNLKTPDHSRAVEYEVDEQSKTVRRIWEYRHEKGISATSMGSAERLPNGGTLICWGRNTAKMILTEVDSTGRVVYEMMNDAKTNVASYRASKYPTRMLAERFTATTQGVNHTFVSGGVALGVHVGIHRLGGPRIITAERHTYGPLEASFEGIAPMLADTLRWTIRNNVMASDSISLRFDLRSVGAVRDPRRAVLWYRPIDGQGVLERVATTRDSATDVLITNRCAPGEYAVGYDVGLLPEPIAPVGGSVAGSVPTVLSWRGALRATAYEVQIARDSLLLSSVTTRRSQTESVVVDGLQTATIHYWRVRAISGASDTTWSGIARFRTALDRPSIEEPVADGTVAPERIPVRWTTVPGAARYSVTITEVGGRILWDTVVVDTAITLAHRLPGDQRMILAVVALRDTLRSYSQALLSFTTMPYIPARLRPSAGSINTGASGSELSWAMRDALSTHIQMRSLGDSVLLVNDTTKADRQTLPALNDCRLYQWRVRAIGRLGPSNWTPFQWFATSGTPTVNPPELLIPADGATVDASDVVLSWGGAGQGMYALQIDTSSEFGDPVLDTFVVLSEIRIRSPLPEDRPLFWRVYETKMPECGSWSRSRQFTIPGGGLGPLSPKDGSVDIPTSGEVRYTTSGRFTEYRVEFFVDTAGSEPEKIYASTTNTCRYLDLQEGTWYRWRVVGILQSGEAVTGSWSRFRTRESISSVGDDDGDRVFCVNGRITYEGSSPELARCVVFDILGRAVPVVVTQQSDNSMTWQPLLTSVIGDVVGVVYITHKLRCFTLMPICGR